MSDNWLSYVPTDPRYQPTTEAADRAAALLKSMTSTDKGVEVDFSDEIMVVEPGSNWSGVECPLCGANAEGWWGDAMDDWWKNHRHDLGVTAACCGGRVGLNKLRYGWPLAFGRFELSVKNPRAGLLTEEQERELAECLGCELIKVWRHL